MRSFAVTEAEGKIWCCIICHGTSKQQLVVHHKMSDWDTDFHRASLGFFSITANAVSKSMSKTMFNDKDQDGLPWVKSRNLKGEMKPMTA